VACGFVYYSLNPQPRLPCRFPCIYRVESRCCRPLQDSNARLNWKQQASVWSYAQICAPFSCTAEVGFAVWEFRDLGSRVMVRSTARVSAFIHTPFSRLRRPWRERCEWVFWGWGLVQIRQLPSSEAQCRMLPCLGRVARSSWLLTSNSLCESGLAWGWDRPDEIRAILA
jgi:hypothetical protein